LTARGPQLVFSRADLDRWLAGRSARRRRQDAPGARQARRADAETTLLSASRQMQASLASMHAAIERVAAELAWQNRQLAIIEAALGQLSALARAGTEPILRDATTFTAPAAMARPWDLFAEDEDSRGAAGEETA
jgi:hypothetical protein